MTPAPSCEKYPRASSETDAFEFRPVEIRGRRAEIDLAPQTGSIDRGVRETASADGMGGSEGWKPRPHGGKRTGEPSGEESSERPEPVELERP